ncbi:50S ribosomal protein L3 N(5)-glutamine methyltransferase [Rhodoferax ferrireducens]|uniref:50S ribosomal protein L3 N(5)-glutamine methyltransferase n=1 Tax=Rhodoferax ferrireducens TaxID=192843 RepID=UPI003BB6A0C6
MTVLELIEAAAAQLTEAGVAFGHGTENAFDEAAWLVLWQLGLPLDTPLDTPPADAPDAPKFVANRPVAPVEQEQVATLIRARITSRQPAAYLTQEAWLMGVPFYVDPRAIVPRSLIAELLVNGGIDYWLSDATHAVLDLCSGNGSLAVLAAMAYPDVTVDASDLSKDALAVARINVDKHGLGGRITLIESDGFANLPDRYDLILCNPPYVNLQSMAELPPEFHAEPALALDGNRAGGQDGMDFIRTLLREAPQHMNEDAVLVLEIGNEREHFEAAFPKLEAIWLETSAGEDQVLLLTREALRANREARQD